MGMSTYGTPGDIVVLGPFAFVIILKFVTDIDVAVALILAGLGVTDIFIGRNGKPCVTAQRPREKGALDVDMQPVVDLAPPVEITTSPAVVHGIMLPNSRGSRQFKDCAPAWSGKA